MMASPTSAREWKRPEGEELKLPSGNVCLVRRPGMEKLFEAGVLPDELTKIAVEAIDRTTAKPQDHKKKGEDDEVDPEMMKKFLATDHALTDIFSSFDRVTAMCVIDPQVRWHLRHEVDDDGNRRMDADNRPAYETIPVEDRDVDILYTDDIDQEDKTFIFNFAVGGTRDLEQFREEYSDAVATVQPGEDVAVSSESTGRHTL